MMNESAQKFPHSRAWFLAGLTAVFLRALPNLRYPLGPDQGVFCILGQGLLHGQLPYRDLWDTKPPGISWVFAPIVKVFGPVMWSLGVVDVVWLLAVSCCIFYFARRFLGAPAAAFATVFNAVRHCRQGYMHAAQPETFLMLCVFGTWFLLKGWADTETEPSRSPLRPDQRGLRRYERVLRCVAAGLLMGGAFWLKYNAAVFFPFVILLPFLDFQGWDHGTSGIRTVIPWRDWLVGITEVGLGFVFSLVAVVGWFWLAGAWPAMKEVQFEIIPRFAAGHFGWEVSREGLSSIVWALRQTQFHVGFWTEIMAPLSLLIAWRRREVSFLAPVFLFLIAGLACAAVQGRFHSYYFETCHPFFSMLWGYVCIKAWEAFRHVQGVFTQRRWIVARSALWLVLASLVFALFAEEGVRIYQQYEFLADWWRNPELSYRNYWPQLPHSKLGEEQHVISYLRENSQPDDEVYVWGFAPHINFLSQRQNPTRFVYNHPLIATWGLESWRQELVRALETKRPRYVVVERHDSIEGVTHTPFDSEQYLRLRIYPALTDLVNRQYQPAVNYTDFEVYKLK